MKRTKAELMRQASRLIQAGDPQSATRLIQAALAANAVPAEREHSGAHSPNLQEQNTAEQSHLSTSRAQDSDVHTHDAQHWGAQVVDSTCVTIDDTRPDASATNDPPTTQSDSGTFSAGVFSGSAGTIDYRLFSPSGPVASHAPMLVMLHGCTQDAEDFAIGTQMNTLAQQAGLYVLYPIQSSRANMNQCWNWFEPAHQFRGAGEPALLSALTTHMISQHAIDGGRVYIAGLSAGGAMALIMAEQYPDQFAAVGVHSGLPTGAARSMPEALTVMRNPNGHGELPSSMSGLNIPLPAMRSAPPTSSANHSGTVPLIVFHGHMDRTVHYANADNIVEAWCRGYERRVGTGTLSSTRRSITAASGHRCDITSYSDESHPERPGCEYWQLMQAGHYWSGGNTASSHTDSNGPDASAEMMRFFLSV